MTIELFCDTCGAALANQVSVCPVCGQVQPVLAATPLVNLRRGFILQGRYRILEQIGAGGFGVVYKAWHITRGRMVAIKQITLATLSAREVIDATASYNREITLLPRLRYAGLPAMYDHFTDPGHWYIVMEYIAGQTLEELLATLPAGRMDIKEVLQMGVALCDMLGYLHAQEPPVIFRDMKPGNIMVTRDHLLYLIDFGIARYYRSDLSKDTGSLGSPGYAAPEQYGKAQSTPQTDIYGLGVTLQTLLTGKEPLEIKASGIPADCSIPDELQTLLDQMMEVYPSARPPRIEAVRSQLQLFLEQHYLSLATLRVYFSWLTALWSIFVLIVGVLAFNGISAALIWMSIVLCFLSFHLYKAKRKVPGKLSRAMLPGLLKEALKHSNGITLTFVVIILLTLPYEILSLAQPVYIAYSAVYIAGYLLIRHGWLPFLRHPKQWPGSFQAQKQQSGRVRQLVMWQTRKRP